MTSTTFTCSLETFKKLGKEFDQMLSTCRKFDEAEAGWKCLSLHYLGIIHEHEASPIMAAGYLKWWGKRYIEWQMVTEAAKQD